MRSLHFGGKRNIYVQNYCKKQDISKKLWKRGFSLFRGAQVAFKRQIRNAGHPEPWYPEGQGQTGYAVTFPGSESRRHTKERELNIGGEVLDKKMGFR